MAELALQAQRALDEAQHDHNQSEEKKSKIMQLKNNLFFLRTKLRRPIPFA